MHQVVGCLAADNERTVLGPVPAAIGFLQVKPELVAAARCQLMKQVVAKPEVASRVVEPDFILRPRTVEDIRPVDVLLDQQRNTVDRYRNSRVRNNTRSNIVKPQSASNEKLFASRSLCLLFVLRHWRKLLSPHFVSMQCFCVRALPCETFRIGAVYAICLPVRPTHTSRA